MKNLITLTTLTTQATLTTYTTWTTWTTWTARQLGNDVAWSKSQEFCSQQAAFGLCCCQQF